MLNDAVPKWQSGDARKIRGVNYDDLLMIRTALLRGFDCAGIHVVGAFIEPG